MHNTIVAIGHLVADPTSQTTSNGKTICRMRMCISDSNSKNKCFIDVECWEKLAETCIKYLEKGREIYLEGELSSSSWTNKEGVAQTKNFIKADRVKFLRGGSKDGASDKGDATAKAQAPSNNSSVSDDDDIPF